MFQTNIGNLRLKSKIIRSFSEVFTNYSQTQICRVFCTVYADSLRDVIAKAVKVQVFVKSTCKKLISRFHFFLKWSYSNNVIAAITPNIQINFILNKDDAVTSFQW